MKSVFILSFFLFSIPLFSQDYFSGEHPYCTLKEPKNKILLDGGLAAIRLGEINTAVQLFFTLVKRDSAFCDAYFFLGYSLRLQNKMKQAINCYQIADKLADHKAIEFKVNLASAALLIGADSFARKKYEEIITYFPDSPEGYYGIAMTAVELGDVEHGLKNINIAMERYTSSGIVIGDEVDLINAILLAMNKRYEEGKECFEKLLKSKIRKQDFFNIYYSLCLLKVSELKNDEDMRKKARKYYRKIDKKEDIPSEAKSLLIF